MNGLAYRVKRAFVGGAKQRTPGEVISPEEIATFPTQNVQQLVAQLYLEPVAPGSEPKGAAARRKQK